MRIHSLRISLVLGGLALLLALMRGAYLSVAASTSLVTPPLDGGAPKPQDLPIRLPFRYDSDRWVSQGYGGYCSDGPCDIRTHFRLNDPLRPNDYYALDFPMITGTQIAAIADGRVRFADWTTGGWAAYGRVVCIDHVINGSVYSSFYAHLSSISVNVSLQRMFNKN